MSIRIDDISGALADYLTAEHGMDLCVWADGSHSLVEQSTVWRSEGPVSRVRCPGIGNLDSEAYTLGFASWDDDKAAYVVDGDYMQDTGRVVGQLADVIRECVADGDVLTETNELLERLQEDADDE